MTAPAVAHAPTVVGDQTEPRTATKANPITVRSTQAITTAGWENALPSVTLPDTWRDGATADHLSQLGR